MPSILRHPSRPGAILLLLAALLTCALPVRGHAAPSETTTTETAPAGDQTDSSKGVVAAVICGASSAAWVRTGFSAFLGIAIISCVTMILDALNTPD